MQTIDYQGLRLQSIKQSTADVEAVLRVNKGAWCPVTKSSVKEVAGCEQDDGICEHAHWTRGAQHLTTAYEVVSRPLVRNQARLGRYDRWVFHLPKMKFQGISTTFETTHEKKHAQHRAHFVDNLMRETTLKGMLCDLVLLTREGNASRIAFHFA